MDVHSPAQKDQGGQTSWETLKRGDLIEIEGERFAYVQRFDLGDQIIVERIGDRRRFRIDRSEWGLAKLTRKNRQ